MQRATLLVTMLVGALLAGAVLPALGADPDTAFLAGVAETVRRVAPDAAVEVREDGLTARRHTLVFTVHRQAKTGEFLPQTDRVEGPNVGGFLLTLTRGEGPCEGPSVMPQTLYRRYWETWLDRVPAADGRGCWSVALACGARLDPEVRKALIDAARSGGKPAPSPGAGRVESAEAALAAAAAYLERYHVDTSRYDMTAPYTNERVRTEARFAWRLTWKLKPQSGKRGRLVVVVFESGDGARHWRE
ncbi:MAG: hypothetical protein KA419_03270 [Acidobacteria bacterium]|nr:hypothetical protein [Acidobacteriota bacterium]